MFTISLIIGCANYTDSLGSTVVVLRQGQNLDGSRLADGSEAQSAAQTSNAVLA